MKTTCLCPKIVDAVTAATNSQTGEEPDGQGGGMLDSKRKKTRIRQRYRKARPSLERSEKIAWWAEGSG